MEARASTLFLVMIFFLLSWCISANNTKRTKEATFSVRNIRSYKSRSKEYFPVNSISNDEDRDHIFSTKNSTKVTVQTGGTARLPCEVQKPNVGVVSWIRKNDLGPTILTVGLSTYIADDRFLVEHGRHHQNWDLVIKHVQISDAGTYECLVSLHPATSILVELRVIEAVAEISGAPDLHIRAGSRLRIVCRLRHSTEPPAYVFWYHDNRMINHDPGVKVTADRTNSVLRVEDVDPSFSGNYTCYPSKATPAYVNVHVLNATEEENPAAMMHNGTKKLIVLSKGVIYCLFSFLVVFYR